MTPFPDGFGLHLDRSVRTFRRGTVLAGGHPGRLITLTPRGAEALQRWLEGDPASTATRELGRRLVDAGLAHPVAPKVTGKEAIVTVVIPVHNRTRTLDRCLTFLGVSVPVVVVDDGSDLAERVAEVCQAHGARLIRRPVNGGPGGPQSGPGRRDH